MPGIAPTPASPRRDPSEALSAGPASRWNHAVNDYRPNSFDADIGELRGLIAQMGGLAERAIAGAVEALQRHDLVAAERIVAEDKKIDVLEKQVEHLAVRIIAQRAPVDGDLR